MRKNTRIVLLVLIGSTLVLAIVFLLTRPRRSEVISCDDGTRRTIDMGDFETKYFGYSAQLEVDVRDKAKIQGKISPVQFQQISDSLQSTNEFHKLLVAQYNSCAITRVQFGQYAAKFQALEGLAKEISLLESAAELSPDAKTKFSGLIAQYADLASELR